MILDEKASNEKGKGFTAKCKGFTIKEGNINKDDYDNVLTGKIPQLVKETTQIRSSFSNITKSSLNKVSLSSLNNKGVVVDNQAQTVLPFYKNITE
jgi:phage-related protein